MAVEALRCRRLAHSQRCEVLVHFLLCEAAFARTFSLRSRRGRPNQKTVILDLPHSHAVSEARQLLVGLHDRCRRHVCWVYCAPQVRTFAHLSPGPRPPLYYTPFCHRDHANPPRCICALCVCVLCSLQVYYYVFERALPAVAGVANPSQHVAAIRAGKRPPFTNATPRAARRIIERCWATEPAERPQAMLLLDLWDDCPMPSRLGSCLGGRSSTVEASSQGRA